MSPMTMTGRILAHGPAHDQQLGVARHRAVALGRRRRARVQAVQLDLATRRQAQARVDRRHIVLHQERDTRLDQAQREKSSIP
jgi:hypothetical protein